MISADRQTKEAGLYLQAESRSSQHPHQEFPPPTRPVRGGDCEEGGEINWGFHLGLLMQAKWESLITTWLTHVLLFYKTLHFLTPIVKIIWLEADIFGGDKICIKMRRQRDLRVRVLNLMARFQEPWKFDIYLHCDDRPILYVFIYFAS